MIKGELKVENPIRWAMVGGGRGSEIGYAHRPANRVLETPFLVEHHCLSCSCYRHSGNCQFTIGMLALASGPKTSYSPQKHLRSER